MTKTLVNKPTLIMLKYFFLICYLYLHIISN